MKTSNIIIIAFAILIVSGMLFLFADSKKYKEEEKNKISFKEFSLSQFDVIVAEKGSDVHIDRSDSTKIKIEYVRGKKTPSKLYEVINDTLHVYGGLRTFVKCKQITQIISKKTFWVGVGNFAPDSLIIKMNGGQLCFNNESKKTYRFNAKAFNVRIAANDSASVNISNARLGNLSVTLNNAKVINNCDVTNVNAKLSNKAAFISLDNIGKLIVEKDIACQVRISNQNVY